LKLYTTLIIIVIKIKTTKKNNSNKTKKANNNKYTNEYPNNNYINESPSINRELNSIITSIVVLSNLGNTCLQNLILTEDFIIRLLTKKVSISRLTQISYYFFNLCKEIANSTRAVSPNKLKEKFG